MGIGPTQPAWKAGILPLNYTRIRSLFSSAPTASLLLEHALRDGALIRGHEQTRLTFGAYVFYHIALPLSTFFRRFLRNILIFYCLHFHETEGRVAGRRSDFEHGSLPHRIAYRAGVKTAYALYRFVR